MLTRKHGGQKESGGKLTRTLEAQTFARHNNAESVYLLLTVPLTYLVEIYEHRLNRKLSMFPIHKICRQVHVFLGFNSYRLILPCKSK